MATSGAIEYGAGGYSRFSPNAGRTLTSEASGVARYPSPFFDIAQTYLPSNFKTMLRWCRYYFLTNPLINAVCYKMAEYPVTPLVFDTDNEALKNRWSKLFNQVLRFPKFEVECGLDYNVYGNCFISVFYPFRKYLRCKKCGHGTRADVQKYKFRNFRFHGRCTKCGNEGEFRVQDVPLRSSKEIRLIRWNPEYITVEHNESTEESRFYYTVPPNLANQIRLGKAHVVERTPQIFLEALQKNKAVRFNEDNIYHMKRPTIAQKDKGWGLSMILPVLKDVFYLQILRKAQEAIAVEHIVPLRILFPTTASSSSDAYGMTNLTKWQSRIESELLKWRLDNNYIPILPVPIGQETLGGGGRALMLSQEYRVWAEHIIAGMGPPQEFVFGGLSFSGSNVSMRMLENHFLDHKNDHDALVQDFLMPNIGAFMGWETVSTHFQRFKMADDLQRAAYHLQLNQAGLLSNRALLEETNWDSDVEAERIAIEQKKQMTNQREQAIGQAAIQGQAQIAMQRYATRAQRIAMAGSAPVVPPGMSPPGGPGMDPMAMGQMGLSQQEMALAGGQGPPPMPSPPGEMGGPMPEAEGSYPGNVYPLHPLQEPQALSQKLYSPMQPEGGVSAFQIADALAARLDNEPEHERTAELVRIQQHNPHLFPLIMQRLQARQGAHASSAAAPAPGQRAPRRGPEAIAA